MTDNIQAARRRLRVEKVIKLSQTAWKSKFEAHTVNVDQHLKVHLDRILEAQARECFWAADRRSEHILSQNNAQTRYRCIGNNQYEKQREHE